MIGGTVVLDVANTPTSHGVVAWEAVDTLRWQLVEFLEFGLPPTAPVIIRVGDLGVGAIDFAPGLWRSIATQFQTITVEGNVYVVSEWVRALRSLAVGEVVPA